MQYIEKLTKGEIDVDRLEAPMILPVPSPGIPGEG